LLIVVLAATAGLVAAVLHAHRTAPAVRRADQPISRVLKKLTAHGNAFDPAAKTLTVTVARIDDAPVPPLKVHQLQLAAGALGPVHAVVIDAYQGSGPGPLLEDVSPFTAEIVGIRIELTFSHPAQCGRPLSGDPPLLVDVMLPSGRVTGVPLRIDGVADPYRGFNANAPHIPWPQALSELACERAHAATARAGSSS
jgi:hypothetical protein